MFTTISLRTWRTTLVAACAALGLLASATAADAAPGTVTGMFISLTVSDTTPQPGETITVTLSHVGGISETTLHRSSVLELTGELFSRRPAANIGDLSFVPGSCTGQLSNCTFTPSNALEPFVADVPLAANGDTVSGTAQFTVSSTATSGEVISFYGTHVIDNRSATGETSAMNLTVTGNADLGVGLTASAPLLGAHVDYDAAVTNNGPGAATSATVTTQLGSQASSLAAGSPCTFSSTTDQVSCPIGALANGATTHARFTINYNLLSLGALNATATRTASSPTDPNAANDSASANCTAVTSLVILC